MSVAVLLFYFSSVSILRLLNLPTKWNETKTKKTRKKKKKKRKWKRANKKDEITGFCSMERPEMLAKRRKEKLNREW